MNKILKWGLPGMMACSFLGLNAQQINPMTEAVLRDYAEILAENPKDYYTLYDRASQYLSLGEYARALSDIEMALEYTPETDKDYRIAEYSLKSDILLSQKNYDGALEAINAALALNPTSTSELYKAGSIYLMINKPQEALNSFQRLQRESTRSQEAFYGMAKSNAMLGNNQEAAKLINEVENLGKQSFVTYCRIGDLYSDMNDIKNATKNYVIAYTMEDNNPRPIESLKFLGRKNFNAVMESLDEIIASNSDNVALNYIKAILAYDAGQYDKAVAACKNLATGLEEDSPAVYRMLALSQLALNNVPEAVQSINTAEKLAPNSPGVLLDKAEILMNQNPQQAYEAAEKAAAATPDSETTMMVAAKAAIMAGKYPEALNYLNNVVLSNPANGEALLLRGYLNDECLKEGKEGIADYTRAGNIHQSGNVSDLVFAAIGKAKANKKLDAEGMINDAVKKVGNNKDDLYLVAVYYAQTGNLEKAKEFADKAMLNGYGNIYNLQANDEPIFNLKPIRHLMGK